jgi:hypothetical protein
MVLAGTCAHDLEVLMTIGGRSSIDEQPGR